MYVCISVCMDASIYTHTDLRVTARPDPCIDVYIHMHTQLHCVGVPEGGWFAGRGAKESHQEALLRYE